MLKIFKSKYSRVLRISSLSYEEARVEAEKLISDDKLCYAEMENKILDSYLTYGFDLMRQMCNLRYDVKEIIFDCELLQKKWAAENNLPISEDWQFEIALKQAQEFQPEILFLQDFPIYQSRLSKFKNKIKSIKKVLVHNCFPVEKEMFEGVDIILAGIPYLQQRYKKYSNATFLFYHYFNNSILEKIKLISFRERKINLGFCGSSGFGYGYTHYSRYTVLNTLLSNFPVQFYLFEPEMEAYQKSCVTLSDQRKNSLKYTPKRLTDIHKTTVQPPKFGLEYYKILNDTKILLNIHTDFIEKEVGNLRLFQASGMGCLTTGEGGTNLNHIFKSDEILSFTSLGRLFEKLEWAEKNRDQVEEMALKAHINCLENHTAKQRANLLHKIINL